MLEKQWWILLAHRVLQCINFTVERLNLPPGLIGLLLGLPQRIIIALCRLSQISKLWGQKKTTPWSDKKQTTKQKNKNVHALMCDCVDRSTLDLYHSSDSCMFFRAMVSYWALMSLSAPVRSGLDPPSTSIFSCCVCTVTWTSWISC